MASDYIVSSGVTSSGITLGSGDPMEVLSGGSAVNTTISNGTVVTVSSGGVTNLTAEEWLKRWRGFRRSPPE